MNEDRKWLTPNHLDFLDWVAFALGLVLVVFIGWYFA